MGHFLVKVESICLRLSPHLTLIMCDSLFEACILINAGIRVQSLKKGQIIMDIDLRWGGDPNIVIEVDALVASIPIQVGCLNSSPV